MGEDGRERNTSSEDDGDNESVPNSSGSLETLEADGSSERRLCESIAAREAGDGM